MSSLRRLLRTDTLLPYWLLLPSVVYLIIFFVLPLSHAFLLSFRTDDGQLTLEYFKRMVNDVNFLKALKNTFLLTIIIVPVQIATALAIALLINTGFRGSHFFLYICAIPLGISDLAAGLIWFSIFTGHGYLNSLLYSLGIFNKPFYFLSQGHLPWTFGAILAAEHWRATAIVLVVLVAGLQMISKDYLEAAEVMGASRLQRLWYVILPLLKPSLQAALIIRTIFAFEVFAVVIALAGELVPVLASQSYWWYALYRNLHIAAAYGVLLMVLSVLVTWGYLRFLRTKEETLR
jgi:multiple sugar transport system permease protein